MIRFISLKISYFSVQYYFGASSTVAGSAAGVVVVGFTYFFGGCERGVAAIASLFPPLFKKRSLFTILFGHTLKQHRCRNLSGPPKALPEHAVLKVTQILTPDHCGEKDCVTSDE